MGRKVRYCMTKMEMFVTLRTLAVASENADLVSAIDHEMELLTKHAISASSKPDAKTIENAALKAEIHAILLDVGRPMSIPEIVENVKGEYKNPVTNGRVSSLLTSLKKDNKVERTEVKRIAHFAVKGE